jgi:hypothetical protein
MRGTCRTKINLSTQTSLAWRFFDGCVVLPPLNEARSLLSGASRRLPADRSTRGEKPSLAPRKPRLGLAESRFIETEGARMRGADHDECASNHPEKTQHFRVACFHILVSPPLARIREGGNRLTAQPALARFFEPR